MNARYDVAGGVGTITLDSPHNRNALSRELMVTVRRHLAEANAAEDVRMVVLSHTGPVFCSGMDLAESAAADAQDLPVLQLPALLEALWTLPKPVIARVGGAVRAGGLGLLAACDLAIAARSATFGFSEVRRGLVPALLVATVLPQLAPVPARELFLTGEVFDGVRAAEIGLVSAAVPEVDVEVARRVESLLQAAPGALAETKRLVRGPFPAGRIADMQEVSARQFASAEAREGMAAFREKRPPSWITA
ncbi:MAG TPA: enoyl-CoA hydratase-related protein [Mycobacteriales bacterium]|nr:enoyl-CoA hydratase-related protein [Mycobacteriales bacterium]